MQRSSRHADEIGQRRRRVFSTPRNGRLQRIGRGAKRPIDHAILIDVAGGCRNQRNARARRALRSKANLTVTGKTRVIKGEDRKFCRSLQWAHQARAAADSEHCLASRTRRSDGLTVADREKQGRGRNHEEIGRHNLAGVIPQKCAPRLRGRLTPVPRVFRNGRLRHLDPELQQFAMMRGAPHPGFACAIVRISVRTSGATVGRAD